MWEIAHIGSKRFRCAVPYVGCLLIPAIGDAVNLGAEADFVGCHGILDCIIADGVAILEPEPGTVEWIVAIEIDAHHQIKLPNQL